MDTSLKMYSDSKHILNKETMGRQRGEVKAKYICIHWISQERKQLIYVFDQQEQCITFWASPLNKRRLQVGTTTKKAQ